jgi:hypothetical protein
MPPSYQRTRKEAIVAGLLLVAALLWVIPVSYGLGQDADVRSIGGIPEWAVWGVFLPWGVFFLIHCWFSLVFMRDDRPGPGDE